MARYQDDLTEANERDAWELRRKGWTQERIAAHLGVDQSTVSRMLSRVNKRLAKEFAGRVEEIKAEHHARLDYIYEEAMGEWERSKEPADVVKTSSKSMAVKPEKGGKGGKTSSRRRDDDEPEIEEIPGQYLGLVDTDTGDPLTPEERALRLDEQRRKANEEAGLTVVEENTSSEKRGRVGDADLLDVAARALSDQRKIWGIDAPQKREITGKDGKPVEVSVAVNNEARQKAAQELEEWRREMNERLSSMPSAPQT